MSDVKELIDDMQTGEGAEVTPKPKSKEDNLPEEAPGSPQPIPGGGGTEGAPPKPTPEAEPAPTSKPQEQEPQSTQKPSEDPAFVRGGQEQKPTTEEGDETAPKPEDQETPPATPAEDQTPEAQEQRAGNAFNYLNELTDGAITNLGEFDGFVNHYNELLEQSQQGFEPKFENKRTEWAYNVMAKAPKGEELKTALRQLQVLTLDPNILSEQQLQFEAYMLDPDNRDLSREEGWDYFLVDYDKKYDPNAMAEDPRLKREHTVATNRGRDLIKKAQDDFESISVNEGTDTDTSADTTEVKNEVNNAVNNFGGVAIAFSDDAAEGDRLEIPVEESQRNQLMQNALDFQGWWKTHIQSFVDPTSGRFDYGSFAREVYEMTNHHQIKQSSFEHGFKMGASSVTNVAKNRQPAPGSKDIADAGGAVPAVKPQGAQTFAESAEEAFRKAEMI